MPRLAFRITPSSLWKQAQEAGEFRGELETDGFIHLSWPHQVVGVANHLYREQADLLLLTVDTEALSEHVRNEDLYNLGETYPHLYAALPVEAVLETIPFPPGPDGTFELPARAEEIARR